MIKFLQKQTWAMNQILTYATNKHFRKHIFGTKVKSTIKRQVVDKLTQYNTNNRQS